MSTLSGLLGGAGKPTRITTYTSGSGSFTPLSTSSSWLRVTLVGGGGGGGCAYNGANPGFSVVINSGSGGGGGATATYWIKASEPSYSYQVGAGGTGGVLNTTTVTRGGNTTFGQLCTEGGEFSTTTIQSGVTGGGGGAASRTYYNSNPFGVTSVPFSMFAQWGGALQAVAGGFGGATIGSPSSTLAAGGAIDSATGISGSKAGWGYPSGVTPTGEPGAGSLNNAGTLNPAYPTAPSSAAAGAGGGGSLYGAGGAGGSVQSPYAAAAFAASNGSGYGGGGGGGAGMVNPTTQAVTSGAGGNGSGGLILIEEFTF